MMSKTTNKFSTEVRARAVRMVLDHEGDHPSRWATIVSVAEKIGCVPQTLLEWVKKTEVDSGKRAGVTTDMAEKMKALEREFRGYMTVHLTIPRLIDDPKRVLPLRLGWILFAGMIRPGFLSSAERSELRALARDGLSEARAARRANAIVLLNDGWSCQEVATALLMDDDTVRGWHDLYTEHGITGLVVFNHKGSQGHLSSAAEASVFDFVRAASPRNTRTIGAWIANAHGVAYSHAGLIALLHRLKLEYRKPGLVSAKLDAVRQKAFIEAYDRLLNRLGNDEAVVFADAVHPTHQARVAGCWVPAGEKIAVAPNSGRERLNIHGAINLETGATQMLEVPAADAQSAILLLKAILAAYPALRKVHVFLDNARYHHARMVREWLAGEGARITLHFIPPYSPHLNPIERLWGVMHRNVTHNRCHATFRHFKAKTMNFLTSEVPRNWSNLRDRVTDNFRIINPSEFRVLK